MRRIKQARFRDADKTLDGCDFRFKAKLSRALVFELATARFVSHAEDALFFGPRGTGKSYLSGATGPHSQSTRPAMSWSRTYS